jgi:condensin-2 complex subunit D3
MERESEFLVKLERALISIGEVVLVGFSNDESDAPATSEVLGLKESFVNDPICGIHIKPSQLLLERIIALIPSSLPTLRGNDAVTTPPNIRAISIVTLGKICLRDETLAKSCLNLLLHELHTQEDEVGRINPTVQSNALLVLGDLCVRYTNIVDCHLPAMGSCLQAKDRSDSVDQADEFEIVRMHAVLTLSTLLLQDFIKWRGLLFYRFLAATADASGKVAQIAKALLCGPLLNKQPNLFHNNFVEAIFVLNGCLAHPISKAVVDLGENGAWVSVDFDAIKLSGSQNRSRRHQIYSMMLDHLTDEHKIGVTARLAKEVFGSALNGGDLNVACKLSAEALLESSDSTSSSEKRRLQCAFNVVKDTFSVLTSPLCQVGRDRCTDEQEDGGESNFSGNGFPELHLAAVKGRLLTTISSKQTVQVIVPILCNMKSLLEDSQSELLQDLMLYLVYIYRRYKEEVKEVLSSDSILLQEIDFDTRQFERLRRESQAFGGNARAASPVTPHPIFHL